jgi:hypothetical protein
MRRLVYCGFVLYSFLNTLFLYKAWFLGNSRCAMKDLLISKFDVDYYYYYGYWFSLQVLFLTAKIKN